jgi:hypothetical protein
MPAEVKDAADSRHLVGINAYLEKFNQNKNYS